jgi:ribosomal protein S1
MTEKIDEDDLWCEYSDMPSPLAYTKRKGYSGVVNYEKLSKSKKEQDEKKNSKTITLVVTQVPKEETKINLGSLN